jgi:hypothetical protein
MEMIDVLKEQLNSVSQSIPKNQWTFFHKGSITNFINYLDFIKDQPEKEKISEILINCLKDVELNFQPEIDYSVYLFNAYLKYVVPTYQNRMGFWPVPSKNALIIYIILIIAIFIMLLGNIYIETLYCLVLLFFVFKMVILVKNHKVFGFRY